MKFIKTTLILLLLISWTMISFSLDSTSITEYETANVIFNSSQLNEIASAKIIDGNLMLPMRTYFEILGASIRWIDSSNEIIAYKNNTFIKLKLGSKSAYSNGKEFKLKYPPTMINETIYIPADFICDAFGIKKSYDKTTKTLKLDLVKSSVKFNFIKDDYFKRIPFDDLGIYISIPQEWSKSEGFKNKFEYSEHGVNYTLDVSSITLKKYETVKDLIDKIKLEESKTYSNNIIYTGSYDDTINGINATVLSNVIKEKRKEIRFLLKDDQTVFIMKFSYNINAPETDAIDTINLIAKSFQISNFTINYQDEHYVEYDIFSSNQIKIDQEIFSNMEVKGVMNFSGTLKKDSLISGFRVTVERLGKSKTFIVAVTDGKFASKLYAPFGLGKHNISIEAIWTNKDDLVKNKNTSNLTDAKSKLKKLNTLSPKILEFSFINLEIDKLEFLIPSDKIQKDDVEMTSLSNLLTYNTLRKFDKARNIFNWTIKNISLKQDFKFDNPKNSIEIFNDAYGNSLEINILYTTLLRSIDIPSRIVLARNLEGTSYYYNELYLNGEWAASDPVAAIRFIHSESESNALPYFLYDLEKYKKNFDKVKILDY